MTVTPPSIPASFLPSPVSARRSGWRVAVLSVVIFAAGALVGGAVTVVVITHRVRHVVQHPDELPGRIAQRLTVRLRLTPEQSERVREVLARRVARVRDVQATYRPKIDAELDAVRGEVRDVLSAEQADRWDAIYSDFRANWVPAEAFPHGVSTRPVP